MRLLVVEDEVDLADALARGLRREGYAVDVANDGAEALERLSVTPYDLVCLDLNRMLTARDAVDDRVAGLDQGADDYLVKPFAFDEVSARVRSLLRRDAGRTGSELRVGPLRLDAARFEAWRGSRRLDLTAKEFALLRYFMAHPGHVLSQERLLEHVWDEHADPFTTTVRVTVGTLRRKLQTEDEEPLIETVVGRGYRLLDGHADEGGTT